MKLLIFALLFAAPFVGGLEDQDPNYHQIEPKISKSFRKRANDLVGSNFKLL